MGAWFREIATHLSKALSVFPGKSITYCLFYVIPDENRYPLSWHCPNAKRRPGGRRWKSRQTRRPAAESTEREVDRLRSLAALVRLGVEGHLLPVLEPRQAGGLHRRDVDEDVLIADVRRNEAESLGVVEELDGTSLGHGANPFLPLLPIKRADFSKPAGCP